MTNVLYYLDLVLADASPKVHEHLAKLKTQVRLSEAIITGLLDVSRTGPAQRSTLRLERLVDEQLEAVGVPPAIRVEREFMPDLPDVRVDSVQVGQILMNLFTNALQAMEGSEGVLTIRASAVGHRVRLLVSDTGPGVRPEDREHVFEPLFTTKARGIGLGLSVSRTLAEANDSTLTLLESNGGATFLLELPSAGSTRGDPVPESAVASTTAIA
jgi:signal transduction histidine kinase